MITHSGKSNQSERQTRVEQSLIRAMSQYRGPGVRVAVIDDYMLPQPPAALLPISETIYMFESLEGEVLFLRDAEETVYGLRLRKEGTDLVGAKIRSD